MIRRIRRSEEMEINLVIKEEKFINPPNPVQRNILLNQALKEFADNLTALDLHAKSFVPGRIGHNLEDRTQTDLADEEIMENWQIPIMEAMAKEVAGGHGDILEIGFGRGVASTMIQNQNVKSHTIIECNDSVVNRFHNWKQSYPGKEINLVHGLWQDTIDDLNLFDGIFFHTYPLDDQEYLDYVANSVTFAEHFFPTAAKHLRPNGAFTYLTNEIDSLSRAHQRLILKHFSSFSLKVVKFDIPADVKDTWWIGSMVVIKAIK